METQSLPNQILTMTVQVYDHLLSPRLNGINTYAKGFIVEALADKSYITANRWLNMLFILFQPLWQYIKLL